MRVLLQNNTSVRSTHTRYIKLARVVRSNEWVSGSAAWIYLYSVRKKVFHGTHGTMGKSATDSLLSSSPLLVAYRPSGKSFLQACVAMVPEKSWGLR